jgi:hypothetical protein
LSKTKWKIGSTTTFLSWSSRSKIGLLEVDKGHIPSTQATPLELAPSQGNVASGPAKSTTHVSLDPAKPATYVMLDPPVLKKRGRKRPNKNDYRSHLPDNLGYGQDLHLRPAISCGRWTYVIVGKVPNATRWYEESAWPHSLRRNASSLYGISNIPYFCRQGS